MIHYHGMPITGADQPFLALMGRHAMVSWAYPDQLPEIAELCQSFTLDNGAFSTWRSGQAYDLPGFACWVEKWHRHPGFDWYVMPDVIDGAEDENQKIRAAWYSAAGSELWGRGVPVWHLHESLDVLREFMAWPQQRIALGSSGEYADPGSRPWWSRMAEALKVLCDDDGRPRVRLHGLRMLDPTIFSHVPLASADSTNVSRNINIDSRWTGAYAPKSRRIRALIMMDRIESHVAAARWNAETAGVQQNLDLLG